MSYRKIFGKKKDKEPEEGAPRPRPEDAQSVSTAGTAGSSYMSSIFSRNTRNTSGTASTSASAGSTGSARSYHKEGAAAGRVNVLETISDVADTVGVDVPQQVKRGQFGTSDRNHGISASQPSLSSPNAYLGAGSPTNLFSGAPSSGGASSPVFPFAVNEVHMREVHESLAQLNAESSALLQHIFNGVFTPVMASTALQRLMRDFINFTEMASDVTVQQLAPTIKVVLHLSDNLLGPEDIQSRKLLLRTLHELGRRIGVLPRLSGTVSEPRNFAIGEMASELEALPQVLRIMDQICTAQSEVADQDGAFIAPVLRGLTPQFSVLTLSFGYPQPEQSHYDMVSQLSTSSPQSVHLYCHKNQIAACANFKPPYRIPTDPQSPPMSLSIASNDGTASGTLGGFIYPKFSANDPALAAYARSTFAMTCGHVCLSEKTGQNPPVSAPSPVLINMYRAALKKEQVKYAPNTAAYTQFQNAIDETKGPNTLGSVVWGERAVVNGAISDVAIIKCDTGLTCRNTLGDDVVFTEYDPALVFGNLEVRSVAQKLVPGMNVFKYGSTSRYTRGVYNGPKIVYWAEGRIQSSEFVVTTDSTPMFALGGDSGAWLLHKVESENPSLSVMGMLHSHDGEVKQFGLFSPMNVILDRLEQVTHVKWGVVGTTDDEGEDLAGGSDSDASEHNHSD
jgi:hypothetical protein